MTDINIDKNVYLLGAGFSKEIGLPLQDDFLLVAKEVYFKNPEKYKHFKTVFDYQDELSKMRKFLNYPLLNLEHLFNLIEMNSFYSKGGDVTKIKEDFTKLICDVLIDRTPNPFTHDSSEFSKIDSRFFKYLSFLGLFIKDDKYELQTHQDTIISFNYDLVLEATACIYNWGRSKIHKFKESSNLLSFNTTFEKENIIVENINPYFTKDIPNSYFPPNAIYQDNETSIKLLKLHGSINWKTADNKTFIVPPTWNKSNPQIRKLWKIAYEEIKNAKRIIVLGYSFPETDIYVKSLLALAVNENKILQNIFFINPNKDIVRQACLSLLDKHFEKYCDYKEWKFSEFMEANIGREFIKSHINRGDNIDINIMTKIL